MSGPYRDGDRLGAVVSTHRTYALSWLIAIPMGVGGVVLAFFLADGKHGLELRAVVGGIVMSMLTIWFAAEWFRLTRIRFVCHERGFVYFDGEARHELVWSDVIGVGVEYVPGALRRADADDGNIVSVVLEGPAVPITVPRELAGFRDLVATFRVRIKVPFQRIVLGSLMERS